MPYIQLDPAIAAAAPTVTFALPEDATKHPNGKSLSGMRQRLIVELGARTDIPVALWNEWINDAYIDLWGSLKLPERDRSFQLVTVANQPLYLLPPSVESVRNVSVIDPLDDTNGLSFEKIDTDSYRKLPPNCGTPGYWLREQNILVLWATPDAAYTLTIDVVARPAIMVGDSDYPAIDDKWHELLLKSAKARAWEAVQNDTKAALVENSVARQVQRKLDKDEADDMNAYPTLRVVRSERDIMRLRQRASGIEPGE